jgi:hypothetical protein
LIDFFASSDSFNRFSKPWTSLWNKWSNMNTFVFRSWSRTWLNPRSEELSTFPGQGKGFSLCIQLRLREFVFEYSTPCLQWWKKKRISLLQSLRCSKSRPFNADWEGIFLAETHSDRLSPFFKRRYSG